MFHLLSKRVFRTLLVIVKKAKMFYAHVFRCFLASILSAPTYGLKRRFQLHIVSVFPRVVGDISILLAYHFLFAVCSNLA